MNPGEALINGFKGTLRTWRGVIVVWILSLILTSLVTIPLKSSFKAVLGKSMITEKFTGGIIAEVIPDFGTAFNSLLSSFSAGLVFLILAWLLMNVFLTGGLFGCLSRDNRDFSFAAFFRKSSENFSSFLVIMVIMNLIILLMIIILFLVPLFIAGLSESVTEAGVYRTFLISGSVTMIFLLVLLVISDYARAWKAENKQAGSFRAVGFGFRQAFRNLPVSFFFMLVVVLIQFLPDIAAFMIVSAFIPEENGDIFLFFLLTQLLFFIKIALRTCRYAGITAMIGHYQMKKSKPVSDEPAVINEQPETSYII